jgi:hypothetical protein
MSRSADGSQYLVTAVPVTPRQTGVRTFCSTEDGEVRVDLNGAMIPDHDACTKLRPIT